MRSSKIAALIAMLGNLGNSVPTINRSSKHRSKAKRANTNKDYKARFSCGFRGWPRSSQKLGLVVAPTMEQVKALEKLAGYRMIVQEGRVVSRRTRAVVSRAGDYNNVIQTLKEKAA